MIFEKMSSDGTPHILDTEVVIEHIGITTDEERKKIEDTIRKIDFQNGDLNHFFDHLAGAIAENYSAFEDVAEPEPEPPKTYAAEQRRKKEKEAAPEPSDEEMMQRMSDMMDRMMGGK